MALLHLVGLIGAPSHPAGVSPAAKSRHAAPLIPFSRSSSPPSRRGPLITLLPGHFSARARTETKKSGKLLDLLKNAGR
ncbi:MAG: hypothetical protein WB507_04780 [Solirubrobacterales bacterium]